MRNSKGDLPLHEAVASGRRELVKWLLDGRPSQVNATNHEGRTPLHIAAATDNADLCRLLLDRGAEVNLVARSSKNEPLTPLDCATTRGHRSTAKYLQMHGGMPASKLANTEIVIDGAPITALPTRRVTSTKIDVHDRIRIEKREVVELSSPVQERRRIKDKNSSDTSNESSADNRKRSTRKKTEPYKYKSNSHKERRKRLMHTQKSFSDGYDSEFEGFEREDSRDRKNKSSKKNRSKSEPSRRHKRSARHHNHYRSRSGTSSESESYSEKRKSRRHRRSKKKSSSPSESSSSESSERRSTKRRGKKTSIHIENDDEKQSVNIVKYKTTDILQGKEKTDYLATDTEMKTEGNKAESEKEENKLVKSVHSETETDTLSVKTNMIITEAQIHMERQSSQLGNSELNVTVDSSNNVSIETTNLSVTHKDMHVEERKLENDKLETEADDKGAPKDEVAEIPSNESQTETPKVDKSAADKQGTLNEGDPKQTKTLTEENTNNDKVIDEQSKVTSKPESEEQIVKSEAKQTESSENLKPPQQTNSQMSDEESRNTANSLEVTRRKSFQILSGPDDTTSPTKDASADLKTSCDVPSIEQTETQEKSAGPAVSFSNKDVIIDPNESKSKADHLMGESVDHSLDPETDKQIQDSILQKDSSESNLMSSEERRKEFTSTTGSSTENAQSIDKGLLSVLDDSIPTSDRAVQQVILENLSEGFDVDVSLLQSSPKDRIRKTSKESQVSSRKNSIYETESYKVLSDIASAPDVTTGILKKTSVKLDELEDGEVFEGDRLSKDGYLGRVPSVSDNELYSHSEINGRRKRFRKKGRSKSRITIRSKSENSERGYESSGLMDSGFEPSPRAIQRRIVSPRLAAYYQQRNASGRYSGKSDSRIPVRKPGDKNAVDMKSVTQRIQTNMRRYVVYVLFLQKLKQAIEKT